MTRRPLPAGMAVDLALAAAHLDEIDRVLHWRRYGAAYVVGTYARRSSRILRRLVRSIDPDMVPVNAERIRHHGAELDDGLRITVDGRLRIVAELLGNRIAEVMPAAIARRLTHACDLVRVARVDLVMRPISWTPPPPPPGATVVPHLRVTWSLRERGQS